MPYDVVTLGETMLRLTPLGMRRLEQATSLEIEVGGTESNLAIGLARLGLRVLWLSRLTNNPLGRLIARTIASHGVDTSRVVWTEHDRVGIYFFEVGQTPRGSRVLYDRRQSAISQMRPEELPAELFQPHQARLLHLTGITIGLGPKIAATAREALRQARNAGWLISFDVNYRRLLWEPAAALIGCEPFLQSADILFVPRGDACLLYGFAPTMPAERMLEALVERYPRATVVMTLGRDGAIGHAPSGQTVHQPAFTAEEVSRLGGGDAFAAGFLYRYLTAPPDGAWLVQALCWGAALAALKYSIPGDAPIVDRQEVERLVAQGASSTPLLR